MRTTIISLFIGLLAWMTGSTWYWVCKVKGHCEEVSVARGIGGEMAADDVATPPIPPFTISFDEQALMSFNNNLRFGKSDAAGVVPGMVRGALDSLAAHLKAHPNRDVQITGLYTAGESNGTDFQNLGLARANFIRQQLMDLGIAGERLIGSYELSSDPAFFALPDTLLGGIDLTLLERASPENGTETARAVAARPESQNLYFNYNSADLAMNSELRAYLTGVIQYLNQHPPAQLLLTGHTDDAGQPEMNLELGRKRAGTVKKFFQDFGLSADRIKLSSQGETKPIAPNTTEAGRKENRRVEVAIVE